MFSVVQGNLNVAFFQWGSEWRGDSVCGRAGTGKSFKLQTEGSDTRDEGVLTMRAAGDTASGANGR